MLLLTRAIIFLLLTIRNILILLFISIVLLYFINFVFGSFGYLLRLPNYHIIYDWIIPNRILNDKEN